jgi:hypothetical protein
MKANLIPKMSAVQLMDRDSRKVSVDIKAFQRQGQTHVFMSDQANAGNGSIARNGGVFIAQLNQRFGLEQSDSYFYRHVFLAASGSLFGRFDLNWQANELLDYTFTMISNPVETFELKSLFTQATPITFSYAQLKNLMVAS